MNQNDIAKIITITDLIKDKETKEAELAYYEQVLKDLLLKMSMVKQEISLTNTIIDVIKNERADVVKNFIKSKDEQRTLDF